MLTAQTNRLITALPPVLRQAVKDALTEKGVLTEGMLDGERGSSIVYGQLRATSYSGALDALAKYGACKTP